MLTYDALYIGGRWTAPTTTDRVEVRSPHDQSLVGSAPLAAPADVDAAAAAARRAFDAGEWAGLAPERRRALVERFNTLHAARAAEIARLVTAENGTPAWFTASLQTSLAEQTGAFLRASEGLGWEEELKDGSLVRREPVGVVAAVIPWNAPHQSALVKVIPALLAGCTVVLKVATETPLDGLLLGELFTEAGFPEGVVSILPADRGTSEHLVRHPDVDKVAFTGSTRAGRRIASLAGEQLKRVSLELGGKSASIVREDADLDALAAGVPFLAFSNNGQSCAGHTRLLVPRSRYEEVVETVRAAAEKVTYGDPADPAHFVGPLVSAAQRERVRAYIRSGLDDGARLLVGGLDVPAHLEGGNYVRPTVLADVDNSWRVAREEIFGPVLVLIPYEDEDDAVRLANDSPFGLSGGVWTTDPEAGLALARRVRTGMVLVNSAAPGYEAPFGGYKASGIGREFGTVGLGQYVEYKTIAR
ncbi:aldehyde dehydrogenase [Streptomyces evansiae]|uniref:aldehyde dehydrogenase n=1 Tax=Streptomyces evansiae TaxID=3075535 RepID=UPI002884C138|nr:aldehyde dehydrogenase [Streptomyces sp. DSM 41859]MDT0420242.1 aldehyde dehydrogenase [Streptomyces sp. DSM 41859]